MFSYKKDFHIGKMIQQELENQGRSVSWLAKSVYCGRSNIYKLFERETVSVAMLMRISEVMGHDFLKDLYEDKE